MPSNISDAIRMLALFLLVPLFIAAAADTNMPAGSMTEDSVDSFYVTPLGNFSQKSSISHAQAVAAKYFSAEQLVKFAGNLTSSPLKIFRDCGNIIKESMDHYPTLHSQEQPPPNTTISASQRVSIHDIDPNLPTVPSDANMLLTTEELHIMAAFLETNSKKTSTCTCQRIFEWLNENNSNGFQNLDEQGIPHHLPTDPVVEPEDLPQNDAQSSTLGDVVTQDCSAQHSENVTKILENRAASKAPSSLEQDVFMGSPNQTGGNASVALSELHSLQNSVSTSGPRLDRHLTPSCDEDLLSEYQEQTTPVDLPSTASNNSRPEELVSTVAAQAEAMIQPPVNQVPVVREVVFGIGQSPPTIESTSNPSIESHSQPAHQLSCSDSPTAEVEGQTISISQSSSVEEEVSAIESTPTGIDVGQNASASATDPPISSNAQPGNMTEHPSSPRRQTTAPSSQASTTPGNVSEASINVTQSTFIDGKSLSGGEAEEVIDDSSIGSAANHSNDSRTPVQPLLAANDHEQNLDNATDAVVEADPTSEHNIVPLLKQPSLLPPRPSVQVVSTAAAAAVEDAEREASNAALQPVTTINEARAIDVPLVEIQVGEPIPCKRRRAKKPAGNIQPTSASSCLRRTSVQCPPESTTSTHASGVGAQASAATKSQSIQQEPLIDEKEPAADAPETRSSNDDGGSKWMSHILMAGGTVALVILIIASAYLSAKRRRQIKLRLEATSELNTLGNESMAFEYPFRNPHMFACHTSSQKRPVWF